MFDFRFQKFQIYVLESSRKEKETLVIFIQNGTDNDEKVTRDDPKVGPGANTARMRFREHFSTAGVVDFFRLLGHFLRTFSDDFLMIFQRLLF